MKKKNGVKKLALHRETLVQLEDELDQIAGGQLTLGVRCCPMTPSCPAEAKLER